MNSKVIRKNRKEGKTDPPCVVRKGRGGKAVTVQEVFILDAAGVTVAVLSYHPDRPLPCGAVVSVKCLYKPTLVH